MQDERILRTLTSIQKSYKWSESSVEIIYGRLIVFVRTLKWMVNR